MVTVKVICGFSAVCTAERLGWVVTVSAYIREVLTADIGPKTGCLGCFVLSCKSFHIISNELFVNHPTILLYTA
jgi:hypothetical protein